MFGNSRGDFEIPDREAVQDAWYDAFDGVFDSYGIYEHQNEDPEHTTPRGGYENDVFIVNPY